MKLDRFLRSREPSWAELHGLVARARGRAERLGADDVRRLGTLYRGAAADLAMARRSFRGDPVVARLETLVGSARGLVYASEPTRESLWSFLSVRYWRRIRERPVPLLVSFALLFGPIALSSVWAHGDPSAAVALVPGDFHGGDGQAPAAGGTDLGLSSVERTAFSIEIFVNNIRVTFMAFAGGISGGLLTAAALLFNGLIIGVVGGLAAEAGTTGPLLELIVPHGVLELSCIVVAGAAGLRMGWAVVDPGRRRRGAALLAEARPGAELVMGTALWLVLAGLVEGYISPAGLGPAVNWSVGVGLGLVFWGLAWWRGAPAPVDT
ncbi:MAG TPA: stage II sporulation protein M [Acidimicrobiales bacterium]|nr:stage II sporulation protein M [Acidimicrobiales bacterium]